MSCDYCGRQLVDEGPTFDVIMSIGGGEIETSLCSEACLTAFAVAGPTVKHGGRKR